MGNNLKSLVRRTVDESGPLIMTREVKYTKVNGPRV